MFYNGTRQDWKNSTQTPPEGTENLIRKGLDPDYAIVDVSDMLAEIDSCEEYRLMLNHQSVKSVVLPAINGYELVSPGNSEEIENIRTRLERRLRSSMDNNAFDEMLESICVKVELKIEESVTYERDPAAYFALRWIDNNSILFKYIRHNDCRYQSVSVEDQHFDDIPF